jgi:signal transduction histidine kinase
MPCLPDPQELPGRPPPFHPAPAMARSLGRSRLNWLVGLAVLALLALGSASWWASALLQPGDRLPLATAALGWATLLGLAGACTAAGFLWGRERQAAALRAARLREQALTQLSDTWLWRTDAEHGLAEWRPPTSAPAGAWADPPATGSTLWSLFEIASTGENRAGELQARMNAHGPLEALRVRPRRADGSLDPAGTAAWRLQALPQFDASGHFTGYLGTALPVGEDEQRRFDQAVLRSLWPELDFAVLALRPAEAGEWRLATLSDDAAALLKLPASQAPGMAWTQAQALLPVELAAAAAALHPGQSRDEGEWSLSLLPIGRPREDSAEPADPARCGRLLMLRPRATGSSAPATTAADHESFIYSVSHDLRAPIRVVEGFARILKEDYGRFLDRIGNDHVDRVLAAAARMNSMIDALLALSRLQSQPLVPKPVDLSQLATYIVEDLRRESPERAAEITIEPGIVVHGDATLLRIAMENLLGNAWKYSSQCAVARIEFRRELHEGKARLQVSDNGAGFDMRFADRLFGVFQRLHSPKDFQGTGVGLASVRRIVRRHGGDVWAESEVGKGARFYFTLGS